MPGLIQPTVGNASPTTAPATAPTTAPATTSAPPGARGRTRRGSRRRILCVFPAYAHSFGTFQHAYPLLGVQAFMPPQGLLLIAGYLPEAWQVRFVDENIRPVRDRELQWADAVLISGMHVQRAKIERINRRAQAFGRLTVLGGPSVSACPEYYRDVDMLHVGELGDATDALIDRLDFGVERPAEQIVYRTDQRLAMDAMPMPAYHLVDLRRYFLASVQFSSGCPFMCEFCDIPALYGRRPRFKSPERICRELDALVSRGLRGAVYFVDDNFIANPAAARQLLPALIDWQRRHGYKVRFSCEATLNLAQMPDVLAQMQQAGFTACFCGIETPEPDALAAMRKKQNMRQPILESVKAFNDHGIEVVSGIILGLDTDTPDTAGRIVEFIDQSRIPLLTINLLYALPRTPLYERLAAAGRLTDEPGRASNVRFKLPDDQVMEMWRRCIDRAYEPARLYERFRDQARRTFPNRVSFDRRVGVRDVAYGASVLSRVLWHVGVKADYRRHFWSVAGPLLKTGRVADAIHVGTVSHHLIRFARQTRTGEAEAAFYADPNRVEVTPRRADRRRSEPMHTDAHAPGRRRERHRV